MDYNQKLQTQADGSPVLGLDLQTTCYPACFCRRCVTHSFQSDAAASQLQHYHRATHVLLRIGTTAYLHVCCVQIQHAWLPHVSDIISFARTIPKMTIKQFIELQEASLF